MLNYKNFIIDNNIIIKDNIVSYTNFFTGGKVEKLVTLKLSDIHKQFRESNYKRIYEGKYKRKISDEIENYFMLPFSYAYYYFVVSNMRIPKPEELINMYLDMFCKKKGNKYTFKEDYLVSEHNIEFYRDELAGRILRGYNSYNREIELFFKLKEKLSDMKVEYNLKKDLLDGIDTIITYNNKTFGLATYVNTNRSNSFKSRKNTVRHDYSLFNMIDVKATMYGENKNVISYGDVFVYDNTVIDYIRNEIKK